MSRLATSFVLGYHGCEWTTAKELVVDGADFVISTNAYDWLGRGAYFWERDPHRAWSWAEKKKYKNPAVVGAVIDLGNCLDLLTQENQELLKGWYRILEDKHVLHDVPMLKNKKKAHYLDCAVINSIHDSIHENIELGIPSLEPFDTVRAMFRETDTDTEELYPTSAFHFGSHVQIAVLNPSESVRGLFFPPELKDELASYRELL